MLMPFSLSCLNETFAMDKSIFLNKDSFLDEAEISESLGKTFEIWQALVDFTHLNYPNSVGV
jgi:hypothetical protein